VPSAPRARSPRPDKHFVPKWDNKELEKTIIFHDSLNVGERSDLERASDAENLLFIIRDRSDQFCNVQGLLYQIVFSSDPLLEINSAGVLIFLVRLDFSHSVSFCRILHSLKSLFGSAQFFCESDCVVINPRAEGISVMIEYVV
jgi:hypothetical protein